ncbi:ATP phosphoribosyltransferase regulatory subunit [bacterium HR19]|nr:ATP phosphoribosyltransferase regulatory subunit [bacterium HR19]
MNLKEIREIEFRTMKVFDELGFEEIRIPLYEKEVREDFTREIAKRTSGGKVCYRGSIFRITHFGRGEEMYQIGCEIINKYVGEEEIKLCALALNMISNIITEISGGEMSVLIAHQGIAKKILGEYAEYFFKKNATQIQKLIEEKKIENEIAKVFFSVFEDEKKIQEVIEMPYDMKVFSKSVSLKKLFNLSEKAQKDYYSGTVFILFHNSKKIGAGGIYSLFGKEGIGFSINLLKLSR